MILKLQEEEGWWEGVLNGKTGVFPSNFVEVIEEGEPNDAVDSHPPGTGREGPWVKQMVDYDLPQ